jgi:hypothetical protein
MIPPRSTVYRKGGDGNIVDENNVVGYTFIDGCGRPKEWIECITT